jgi:hypothetical protein
MDACLRASGDHARLRGGARSRDGGVREELAAGDDGPKPPQLLAIGLIPGCTLLSRADTCMGCSAANGPITRLGDDSSNAISRTQRCGLSGAVERVECVSGDLGRFSGPLVVGAENLFMGTECGAFAGTQRFPRVTGDAQQATCANSYWDARGRAPSRESPARAHGAAAPRTRLFSTASGRRRQPSYIKVRERIAALRYPATAIDLT